MKKQRAPAFPDSAAFRELWEALDSQLMASLTGKPLYTQGVIGSSPIPPTIR
jgi:hypothetical protein